MNKLVMVLMIIVLFSSCKKPIPADNNINVSGFVIDTVKNKYLPNATVLVLGCNFNFYGLSCNDSVTSTKTNQDGRFSLNFITDGKSHSYYAEVMPMPNDNFIFDNSSNSNREVKLGDNNNLRLKARELNILKVKIKIDSNPYDTLNISTLYGGFDFYNRHHIDTILYFKVFPLSMNYLYFYNWDSKLLKDRSEIKDSLYIKMIDTTYYSKFINILDIKIH